MVQHGAVTILGASSHYLCGDGLHGLAWTMNHAASPCFQRSA